MFVKCVLTNNEDSLTLDKVYCVIYEIEDSYQIKDDGGLYWYYSKNLFVEEVEINPIKEETKNYICVSKKIEIKPNYVIITDKDISVAILYNHNLTFYTKEQLTDLLFGGEYESIGGVCYINNLNYFEGKYGKIVKILQYGCQMSAILAVLNGIETFTKNINVIWSDDKIED